MKNLDENFWLKYFKVYDTLNILIPYSETIEILAGYVHGDHLKILDIGCGTGNLIEKLLKNDSIEYIYGIDYSGPAISMANKKFTSNKLFLTVGDIQEGLPYDDNFFDFVVSNNVLYTIDKVNRNAVMSEIYRVLKPNGRLVMSNINSSFRPWSIYKKHIKDSIFKFGIFNTFVQLIQFIKPTILIFYYNYLINKENKKGKYSFLEKNEQAQLMHSVGFEVLVSDQLVYGNNAFLTVAVK